MLAGASSASAPTMENENHLSEPAKSIIVAAALATTVGIELVNAARPLTTEEGDQDPKLDTSVVIEAALATTASMDPALPALGVPIPGEPATTAQENTSRAIFAARTPRIALSLRQFSSQPSAIPVAAAAQENENGSTVMAYIVSTTQRQRLRLSVTQPTPARRRRTVCSQRALQALARGRRRTPISIRAAAGDVAPHDDGSAVLGMLHLVEELATPPEGATSLIAFAGDHFKPEDAKEGPYPAMVEL